MASNIIKYCNNNNRGLFISADCSDLHFTAFDPQTQYKILEEQFISRIENLPLDMVSINGDIFDHKMMSNSDGVMYANKFIGELIRRVIRPKQCTLLIIGGTYNHDCGQLKLFYHYLNDRSIDVRIVETIRFEYVKNVRVLCIPELAGVEESVYRDVLFNSGIYDTVRMHGTIKGSVPFDEVGNGRLFDIEDFALCAGPIISGHVHKRACFNQYFYYCGSPYSWRFDDDCNKGFFITVQNLDNHTHYIHSEMITSFRYETINLDEMVMYDPKTIVDYIANLKSQGIDYVRVEFKKDVPMNTKTILNSYFRNDGTTKLNYLYSAQDRMKENNNLNSEYTNKFNYLYDPSLSEYDKLSRYINDDMGKIFITAEEIKKIVEEEF